VSKRVKGMGGKTGERLQAEGLTFGPGGAHVAAGGRRSQTGCRCGYCEQVARAGASLGAPVD